MAEKTTIVIVDDSQFSRNYYTMCVTANPRYKLVETLVNAEEAVDYCLTNKVELLIMAIVMRDGIDGLTAAERIKAARPETKIILTTSSAESAFILKAKEIGVDGFWFK